MPIEDSSSVAPMVALTSTSPQSIEGARSVSRKRSAGLSFPPTVQEAWISTAATPLPTSAYVGRVAGQKAVRPLSDDLSSVNSGTSNNEHVEPATPTRMDVDAASHQDQTSAVVLNMSPIERYTVHQTVRDSLFGRVVLASDNASGLPVAIKVSKMDLLAQGRTLHGGKVIENPILEAKMMRIIGHHPNIISLLDEHVFQGLHWMVMEFAPHGEFFDFVCQRGHLDEATARHYFRQMIAALKHLHDHGVCHLDFSLENLLMDSNYDVKLCDFGVARQVPSDGSKFAGITREKPGKLRYMAPEVLGGQPFDGKAADMFSLGVTLYSMLTGNAPFEAAHAKDKRYQYVSSGRLRQMLDILQLRGRVSDDALSLLEGLLCFEGKRLTVDQVLAHPWVQATWQFSSFSA